MTSARAQKHRLRMNARTRTRHPGACPGARPRGMASRAHGCLGIPPPLISKGAKKIKIKKLGMLENAKRGGVVRRSWNLAIRDGLRRARGGAGMRCECAGGCGGVVEVDLMMIQPMKPDIFDSHRDLMEDKINAEQE